MSGTNESVRRHRLTLIGDGALLTAGAFTIGISIAMALDAAGVVPLGEPDPTSGMFLLGLISWLLQVAGFVVGPALAWRLHGRRFTLEAAVGAVAGMPVAAAVLMSAVALATALGWVLAPFSSGELAGPIALASLLVAALVGVVLWLVVDAVADLRPAARTNVPLDTARLVAFVALIGAGSRLVAVLLSGGDLEGFDFLLAGAVFGAAVVGTADFVERFLARREATHERPSHA